VLAKPWQAALACQSAGASRARLEAAELIFHLVDLVAASLEYGLRLMLL
jgi:hypothetical protein